MVVEQSATGSKHVSLPTIIQEGQAAADAMREAAVELPERFPEIKGLLEASARVVEALCDELARRP